MWVIVIIVAVAAFIVGYFLAKSTIKPEIINHTQTVEIPTIPDDYNEYLEWKQNKDNVKVIVSDEAYDKLSATIEDIIQSEDNKENSDTSEPKIKKIKVKVKLDKQNQ